MIVQPAYVGARGVVVTGAAARYGGSGARLLPPSVVSRRVRQAGERTSGRASERANERLPSPPPPTTRARGPPPHDYALLDVSPQPEDEART